MGIEDPIWGKVIIVLFFITILLGALYFSKYRGKEFFSKLSNNEFLKLDETISLSNVSKASLHNLKRLESLKLYVGCEILVSRRNDVIPMVEGNISEGVFLQ